MAEAERLITPGTRLVVVNSPHNPSGAHFSQQEWRRLGELCQAGGAHLFRCVACVRTRAAATDLLAGCLAAALLHGPPLDAAHLAKRYTAPARRCSDEMYRTLEFDPADRLPAAADLLQPGGISLCGMSKAAGMPGVRLGGLATHDAACECPAVPCPAAPR